MGIKTWIMDGLSGWLNTTVDDNEDSRLTDFERLCEELHQGDVLLVEGRSRVSHVIKSITNSPWTHSMLYIGRLDEIRDESLRDKISEYYQGEPHQQLIIEAMLGEGTVVYPVTKYKNEHLRICRPKGLSRPDRQQVISFALSQLGYEYDVRHLLDLARFLIPYGIFPRRWRSTLFQQYAGRCTRNVCSYMMGEAFGSVNFPILPIAERSEDGNLKLYKRNPRLFTPRDFDYSPYFDIIKYPYFGLDDVAAYRALPWDTEGMVCNAYGDCFVPLNSEADSEESDKKNNPDPEEDISSNPT
jgi:permuted papain-like amidase YaeF/Yiix C92 family enzyme